MAVPLRRGGGVKGTAISEKQFFKTFFPTAIELEGRGEVKTIKKIPFFAASLSSTLYSVSAEQHFLYRCSIQLKDR